MRATKKNKQKKHTVAGKKFLFAEMNLFFSECFFYLPKLNVFFRKSAAIQCARWADKKHIFLMRGLSLMRALI